MENSTKHDTDATHDRSMKSVKSGDEQSDKKKERNAFLEYYDKYKITNANTLKTIPKGADPKAILKKINVEAAKCFQYLAQGKYPSDEILEQVVMRNFCTLKEMLSESATCYEEVKDKKDIKQMLDYIVGKYMRLMYICFYQTHSDNKALLKDVAKFAYFYNFANIDSHTIESLSKEYIESIVRPDESDQNEEETKKNLIHNYKRFMITRHSSLLENEAIYVRL